MDENKNENKSFYNHNDLFHSEELPLLVRDFVARESNQRAYEEEASCSEQLFIPLSSLETTTRLPQMTPNKTRTRTRSTCFAPKREFPMFKLSSAQQSKAQQHIGAAAPVRSMCSQMSIDANFVNHDHHHQQKTERRRERSLSLRIGRTTTTTTTTRSGQFSSETRQRSQNGRNGEKKFKSFYYIHLLAIALGLLSLLSQFKSVIGQQQQLPTVIVRGFLNYRTTVDGTVLLFTPDAGQQQQQPIASTIQATSSQPASIEATPTLEAAAVAGAAATSVLTTSKSPIASSERQFGDSAAAAAGDQRQQAQPTPPQASAAAIEPTSVLETLNQQQQFKTKTKTTSHEGATPLESKPIVLASNVAEAQAADQWHPVQATPPLKQSAPAQSIGRSRLDDLNSANLSELSVQPVVQADELTTTTPPAAAAATTTTTTKPASSQVAPTSGGGRPKRPSFSFSNQGARSRQGASGSSSSSPNSINGIRKPSLSGQQQQQQQQAVVNATSATAATAPNGSQSGSEPSTTNAANAFQSRLASANSRLRNRLKHRQHLFGGAGGGASSSSGGHNNASSSLANSSVASLVASSSPPSDALLDVASSVEQPIAAEGSRSTTEQLGSLPAVGSDEILLPGDAVDSQAAPSADPGPTVSSSSASQSSKLDTTGDSSLDAPLSAEQEAGLRPLSRFGELRPSSSSSGHSDETGPKLLRGELQQGALSSGPLNLDALFQSDQPAAVSDSSSEQQQHHNSGTSTTTKDNNSSSGGGGSGRHLGSLTRPNGGALVKPKPVSHNEKLNGWLGQHHNKFVPRPAPKHQSGDSAPPNLSHQLAANLNQLSPSFSVPHISQTATGSSSITPSPMLVLSTSGSTQHPVVANHSSSALSSLSYDHSAMAGSSSQIALAHPDGVGGAAGQQLPVDGEQASSSISSPVVSMQTITRTYSTVLQTSKTRLVPLQVKSSTAIYTITEDYVMTKMMTAYQTMPAGEFILPETSSNELAFEVFDSKQAAQLAAKLDQQQQQAAPVSGATGGSGAPIESQEQPISLDTSPKSANNWLHDFTSGGAGSQDSSSSQQQQLQQLSLSDNSDLFQGNQLQQQQQQQQQAMLALLEQQARDANLGANFGASGETLEQLASQLDPAALLADGAINIPDLNNPLVLAAAIQNPQLAAVILAAQQLKLKQRQNKFTANANANNNNSNLNQQQQQQQQQLFNISPQVSYSTSYSTTIRPSTYTARDTMYTTRLVSFRDGRTVRTRTVSEPGSVIEQVLTTVVTERLPITITIRPTNVIMPQLSGATAGPMGGALAGGGGQLSNNQATINNALFASQLASILARRQHQLQTSFSNAAPLIGANAGSGFNAGPAVGLSQGAAAAATPQQLQAIQHLFNQQKRQQSQQLQHQQHQQQQQQQANTLSVANQFQPNLQQLLHNMQQQPNNANANPNSNASSSSSSPVTGDNSRQQQQQQQQENSLLQSGSISGGGGNNQNQFPVATPSLPQLPKSIDGSPVQVQGAGNGPLTTTLTSLQVRTYTVHNAFKTIFRTITSTVLTPTVLASG